MRSILTLAEAQARLAEIVAELLPGEEIAITKDDRVVARLVGEYVPPLGPRKLGLGIGEIFIVSEDDEHLKDFAGYME